LKKKTDTESFGSEFAMSAGDNALTRKQINASIISKATANEHSFREAATAGYNDMVVEGRTPLTLPPDDSKKQDQ
jgi:hypothetical protein